MTVRLIAQGPTFSGDIAPILYAQCAPCHHENGPGPFPLTSYSEVKKHANQIADVTRRRYMPPWPPDSPEGVFENERRLSDAQVQAISEWVAAGAMEGTGPEPEAPKYRDGWQLGTPDLVVEAPRAFTMRASGEDAFWNFVFDPKLSERRYVRAIEIRPDVNGNSRIFHHANLLVDRAGSTRRLDKGGMGFAGMDLAITRNPFDQESHFLFWKPGTLPTPEPEGFSWRLDPGNLLVLNTHLQPTGKVERIRPAVGIYFTSAAPTKHPIVIQLEADEQLNIAPGMRDFRVSDDFRLPVAADVLAIYPHAHYLGKRLEAFATLPTGERRELILIPDWDLNWQAVYRYRLPVSLPAGSVIAMRYSYDNSSANIRNPHRPPVRVCAGDRASDEMAHLWLQLLPKGPGDTRREIEEALVRRRLEKDPRDFTGNLNLGALLMARLQTQGAITAFREAIRIDPKRPEPHDMLGSALLSLGMYGNAITEFRSALAADPEYFDARYNLARALVRTGKLTEAAGDLRTVANAFPQSARIQSELGELLLQTGDGPGALAQFDKALTIDPNYEPAVKGRATCLATYKP